MSFVEAQGLMMLAVFVLGGSDPAPAAAAPDCPLEVPFHLDQERSGLIVEIRVNGRRGRALLDTGAGHTVVAADLLRVRGLRPARFPDGQAGFVGEAVAASAGLTLPGADLGVRRVYAMNLAAVSHVYGRRIDAVVGQDVLARFESVVLDFSAHRVHLVPRTGTGCAEARASSTH